MGTYYLMGTVLLLLGASSRSKGQAYSDEETESYAIPFPSTAPSVIKLVVTTPASSAAPDITLVRVGSSTAPDITLVHVAKAQASQEPSTASSNVVSTAVTTEHFEGRNESAPTVPTTGSSDQSTAFTTVDLPTTLTVGLSTTPTGGEVDGPKIPVVDRNATNPSTTNNETESKDDEEEGASTASDTDNKTEDNGVTVATTTKRPGQETNEGKNALAKAEEEKRKKKVILIGVIICILVLLLVLMVFMIVRKKKRSGSFRTNSKKKAGQDVWAGQVPELGDGKATQEVAENGTARIGPEATNEEEMTTFTPGEKKMDSMMIEMNELGEKPEANGGEKLAKEANEEEKTPLLEGASDVSPKPKVDTEEFFPAPPVEQELMANGV